MRRREIIAGFLSFVLGILGNLLASGLQQEILNNTFTPQIIIVIVIFVIFLGGLIVLIGKSGATSGSPSSVNPSEFAYKLTLIVISFIFLLFGLYGGSFFTPRINYLLGTETPSQLYNRVTSGTPILTDDFTQPDKYQWDQGTSVTGSCEFTNEGYQVNTPNPNNTQDCHAAATNFSNFAFQTQFVIRSGSGAGLVFRSTVIQPGINRSYRFRIGVDGHWDLVCISCGRFATRPIIDGNDVKNIHGLGSPNTLTFIAKESNIYLYVNDIYLNKTSNDLFNTGRIGLFVVNFSPSSGTTAIFYNVKVWNA
jgi:hypothetical protein